MLLSVKRNGGMSCGIQFRMQSTLLGSLCSKSHSKCYSSYRDPLRFTFHQYHGYRHDTLHHIRIGIEYVKCSGPNQVPAKVERIVESGWLFSSLRCAFIFITNLKIIWHLHGTSKHPCAFTCSLAVTFL